MTDPAAPAPMQRNSIRQPTARLGRTLLVILLGGGAVIWLGLLARSAYTPDGLFHFQRVRALSEALAQGVLFPRIFPDFAFGYGYPVLNFYAPLFYYPPALLHLLGLEILLATRITLLATLFISAAAMAGFLRAIGCRPAAARFGALVYLLFPYRIYDVMVRGALPEFAAFLWLPCVAWSMLATAQAQTPQRRAAAILIAGLCWAGLILTHNLTALMAAFASAVAIGATVLLLIAQGKRAIVGGPLWRMGLAFGLGVLLSAWYAAPALLETGYVGIGGETPTGYESHFLHLRTLLAWSFPYFYPPAADLLVPLPAWLILPALGAGLLLLRRDAPKRIATAAVLTSLLFAIWLNTSASAPLWRVLGPFMSRLQFPWRWQTIVTFSAAVALALLADALLTRKRRSVVRISTLVAAAAVTAYAVTGIGWSPVNYGPADITRSEMWAIDLGLGQVGATWTAEFLPRWVTEQRWAIGREPSDGAPPPFVAPVDADATLVDDGYLHASYAMRNTEELALRFNRFYYPAWAVSAQGVRLATQPVDSLGLLSASLPAGESTVALEWAATPAVWLGRVLTVLGWLYGLLLILRTRTARNWFLATWFALGLLLLAGSSGVTARSLPVQPSGADFGPVQLAGIANLPAHAGADASLAFHWLVQEQSGDLTNFIHLLAPDGTILSQVDAPLAGAYTPATRLTPGEIVRVEQILPIPADVTPGIYTLRIGLYPAGQPQQPLTPAGSDTPFITSLTLEVRP